MYTVQCIQRIGAVKTLLAVILLTMSDYQRTYSSHTCLRHVFPLILRLNQRVTQYLSPNVKSSFSSVAPRQILTLDRF
ncbi:hypothetical protein BDR07DRAFT_772842 [Suillus spraguei]|nr:hypothetical protein BDR07DRAFT_772842 [Suillus spraguei]